MKRIFKINNYRQKETITFNAAANMFTLGINLIKPNHPLKKETRNMIMRTYFKEQNVEVLDRLFSDGFAQSFQLNGREKLKGEAFFSITNTLSVHLKQRLSSL